MVQHCSASGGVLSSQQTSKTVQIEKPHKLLQAQQPLTLNTQGGGGRRGGRRGGRFFAGGRAADDNDDGGMKPNGKPARVYSSRAGAGLSSINIYICYYDMFYILYMRRLLQLESQSWGIKGI